MYVKIETEDFKELYTFQKCKFIPRIGEYVRCKEGTFEVTRIMYTVDSEGIFYAHIKVKSINILQF